MICDIMKLVWDHLHQYLFIFLLILYYICSTMVELLILLVMDWRIPTVCLAKPDSKQKGAHLRTSPQMLEFIFPYFLDSLLPFILLSKSTLPLFISPIYTYWCFENQIEHQTNETFKPWMTHFKLLESRWNHLWTAQITKL